MTASITVTDLVEELSAENRKLVDGLSVWQKCVELVHNYKKCLTDVNGVCVSRDIDGYQEIVQELHQQYDRLMPDIDTAFRSLEDSQQKRQLMAADSGGNGDCDDRQSVRETGLRTLRKPKRFKESDEEISDYCPDGDNGSDAEADDNEKPAVNMKFLAEDDCLVEEDGLIVTKRDPNNGLILVVQLNNTSGQALGFRCNWSDCQFVSVSKDKTADHLRTVHNRTGHFVCHKCPKTFVSHKEINAHVIDKHSNQYKCQHKGCNYKTRHRKHLNEHNRRHTGVRPYPCLVVGCGKRFITRQELRRHNNGVHNSQTFVCEWPGCELTFRTNKAIETHKATHYMV